MRAFWTLMHRWVGLTIAGFLFVSGVTGAIISWDHELDDLLNPHLLSVSSTGPTQSSLQLAKEVEARDPRVRVSYIPLQPEPGESLGLGVDPRVDPNTGRLYEPGYNEVFVDPHTGAELGRREWGAAWPLSRENFVSFLYVLHYSLHIPEMWGIDRWGMWLLGIIAVLWTLDCFVGFYLTLPAKARAATRARIVRAHVGRRSRPTGTDSRGPVVVAALEARVACRWGGGRTKLNFDLHRAFSLWTWIAAVHRRVHGVLAEPVQRSVLSDACPGCPRSRHRRSTCGAGGQASSDRTARSATRKSSIVHAARRSAAAGKNPWAACSTRRNSASTA